MKTGLWNSALTNQASDDDNQNDRHKQHEQAKARQLKQADAASLQAKAAGGRSLRQLPEAIRAPFIFS